MPLPIQQKIGSFAKEAKKELKKAANEVKKIVKENPGSIMVAEVPTGGAATADAATGHTISGAAGTLLGIIKAAKDAALPTALAGTSPADVIRGGHTISGTDGYLF